MTVINGYEQSDREQKLTILNLPSLEVPLKDHPERRLWLY